METSEASEPEVPETEVFEPPEVFNGKWVPGYYRELEEDWF